MSIFDAPQILQLELHTRQLALPAPTPAMAPVTESDAPDAEVDEPTAFFGSDGSEEAEPHEEREPTLLEQLDSRQNDVIRELDELNDAIERLVTECSKQRGEQAA